MACFTGIYITQSYRSQKKKYNQSPFINVKHGLENWPPLFFFANGYQFWMVYLAHSPNGYPNCLPTILIFHLLLRGTLKNAPLFCPPQIVFSLAKTIIQLVIFAVCFSFLYLHFNLCVVCRRKRNNEQSNLILL